MTARGGAGEKWLELAKAPKSFEVSEAGHRPTLSTSLLERLANGLIR